MLYSVLLKRKGELIYNSAMMIQNGKITSIQRKIYPTNYGVFEEAKYFAKGKK